MPSYREILTAVINNEKETIGEVAIRLAKETGIEINNNAEVKELDKEGIKQLKELIDKYKELTGPVAHTICKKAIEDNFEKEKLPKELQEWL